MTGQASTRVRLGAVTHVPVTHVFVYTKKFVGDRLVPAKSASDPGRTAMEENFRGLSSEEGPGSIEDVRLPRIGDVSLILFACICVVCGFKLVCAPHGSRRMGRIIGPIFM